MQKTYYVKNGLVYGAVCHKTLSSGESGYEFIPFAAGRHGSKRLWATPDDAVRRRVPSGGKFVQAESPAKASEVV